MFECQCSYTPLQFSPPTQTTQFNQPWNILRAFISSISSSLKVDRLIVNLDIQTYKAQQPTLSRL